MSTNILHDLYDSDLFQSIHISKDDPDYKEAMQKLVDAETAFRKTYPECITAFEEYQEADYDLNRISTRIHFCKGFRAGAQLAFEMIKPID